MKILVIGPSPKRSKGGMATVIDGIESDKLLNEKFSINIFESFIDGNKLVRLIYSIKAYLKFKKQYKDYDLFHIHMASYGSVFRKAKYVHFLKANNKKVIVHIHGAAFMVFYNKLTAKRQKYIRELLNSADMVIGLSDEWKNTFEREFGIKNCVALNNGIDVEAYAQAVNTPEHCQKAIVSLGRLGQRKGTYDLVESIKEAVKIVPDLKCYIAGDGQVEEFKKIVTNNKLDKNIEIVGWVDFQGKIELLKKASTVVLPSYNEGLPMAILEGMACGKAIISTEVGAIPEVISHENGILIKPGDRAALTEALIYVCREEQAVREMSKANIEKIDKEFSRKKMHEKLASYYERVYNNDFVERNK